MCSLSLAGVTAHAVARSDCLSSDRNWLAQQYCCQAECREDCNSAKDGRRELRCFGLLMYNTALRVLGRQSDETGEGKPSEHTLWRLHMTGIHSVMIAIEPSVGHRGG